jgi:hypothetical protein
MRRRRTIARSRASSRPLSATLELVAVPDAVRHDLDELGGTNVDHGHAFMVGLMTQQRLEKRDCTDVQACCEGRAHEGLSQPTLEVPPSSRCQPN